MIQDKIVSIRKVGVRNTVDIEVDGDHLFFCNKILTHNSAAGEAADVTEENIQGGISKIQAADNVIGFIPDSQNRQNGFMRAKFLKTRDSGGVGSYVDFSVDWSTLTFSPMDVSGKVAQLNASSNNQQSSPPKDTRRSSGVSLNNFSKADLKTTDDDDDDSPFIESTPNKSSSKVDKENDKPLGVQQVLGNLKSKTGIKKMGMNANVKLSRQL